MDIYSQCRNSTDVSTQLEWLILASTYYRNDRYTVLFQPDTEHLKTLKLPSVRADLSTFPPFLAIQSIPERSSLFHSSSKEDWTSLSIHGPQGAASDINLFKCCKITSSSATTCLVMLYKIMNAKSLSHPLNAWQMK